MKYVLFAAMSMFSLFAAASEAPAAATQSDVYNYSQNLDIAKVISISSVNPNTTECGPELAHMVYVDSKGARHDLQYTRMGENCEQS